MSTAVIDAGSEDESVVGVYTSEEVAFSTANRISPDAAEARRYTLDELPEWIEDFERIEFGKT
jgi:hypothetical protein